MRELPLIPFLATLADDGITLLPRDYDRIRLVLATGGVWSLARLRDSLLALLARDPETQERFLQRFDQFFSVELTPQPIDLRRALAELQQLAVGGSPLPATSAPVVPRPRPALSVVPAPQQRPRRDLSWLLLAGASLLSLIGLTLLGLLLLRLPTPVDPAPPPRLVELSSYALDFGQLALDSTVTRTITLTVGGFRAERLEPELIDPTTSFAVESFWLAPAGETGVLTVTLTPRSDRLPAELTALSGELRITTTDREGVAFTVKATLSGSSYDPNRPAPPIAYWRLYSPVPQVQNDAPTVRLPDPRLPFFVVAAVLGLAGLLYWFWLRRSSRVPDDLPPAWDPAGPRHFSLRAAGGARTPLLDDDTLGLLADSMGYVTSEAPGERLDVRASVDGTLRQGGVPRLTFLPRRQVRSLLVLEDARAEASRWNTVVPELVAGLASRGVNVIHGRFDGGFARFQTPDGTLHHLEDLEDERDRLVALIFTDGKGTYRCAGDLALENLARWPMLAWLDLREPRHWDQTLDLPARLQIPVEQANAAGLVRAVRRFTAETLSEGEAPADALPEEQYGPARDRFLERLLGDALLWAQDCARVQPVSPGLADRLRARFHPALPPERIERLYTLPGTQVTATGLYFAPDVHRFLRRGFNERRDEAEQRAVLEFLLAELAQIEPEHKASLSHLTWEMYVERVRLDLDPDRAAERLAQLSRTPLGDKIQEDLHGFGLPEQADATPLRVRPTKRDTLQRLKRLVPTVDTPLLPAYPIRPVQRAILAGLLLLAVGTGAWGFTRPGITNSVVLELPEQLVSHLFFVRESTGGSSRTLGRLSLLDPGLPTGWDGPPARIEPAGAGRVRVIAPVPPETSALAIHGGGAFVTQAIEQASGVAASLSLGGGEQTWPCVEAFENEGYIIERCPAGLQGQPARRTEENQMAQLELSPWRELVGETQPGMVQSIGIEVAGRDSRALRDWRELLLASGSVDTVYRIDPREIADLEAVLARIRLDLGYAESGTQALVWTDGRAELPRPLRSYLGSFGATLLLEDAEPARWSATLEGLLRVAKTPLIEEAEIRRWLRDAGVSLPPQQGVGVVLVRSTSLAEPYATGTLVLEINPPDLPVSMSRMAGEERAHLERIVLSGPGSYTVPAGRWEVKIGNSLAATEYLIPAGGEFNANIDFGPLLPVAVDIPHEGLLEPIETVAFDSLLTGPAIISPDGLSFTLISASAVEVRSLSDLQRDMRYSIPLLNVSRAVFSPDGRYLALFGPGVNGVKIYDFSVNSLLEHSDGIRVTELAFHPDSSRLAMVADDGSVAVTSLSEEILQANDPNSGQITRVSFSPDGSRLLGLVDDGTMRQVLLDQGQDASFEPVPAISGGVSGMAWSPDGTRFLTYDDRGRVQLWNSDGTPDTFVVTVGGVTNEIIPHTGAAIVAAYRPDGQHALIGYADGVVVELNLQQANWITYRSQSGRVGSLAYSSDGRYILVGYERGQVELYGVNSGDRLGIVDLAVPLRTAAFTPDGSRILTVHTDGTIALWRITETPVEAQATATSQAEFPLDPTPTPSEQFAPDPTVTPPVQEPTATTEPTLAPAPPTRTPPPRPAPTQTSLRLRMSLLNYNDNPQCISVRVTGIDTSGWALSVDGTSLRGTFQGENARVCGLAAQQEVTITLLNAGFQVVPGGQGVPARGGAILIGEWR